MTTNQMREALDEIGGLSRALRHGGPVLDDLQELSDALTHAVDIAHAALSLPEQQASQGWKLVRVELLEKLRDFIDTTTAPAYPAGADLADEIDAMLAASPAGPVSGFKVDMSLVEKWQRENNVVQEPGSREAAMVIIRHDENGRPTVWCDPEIADLVAALNTDSLSTVASCSGHGYRPGSIILKDGRRLLVFDNEADYERAEGVFPLDINGHPVTRDDEFGSIDTSEREAVDPSEIIAAAGVATVGRQA